MSLCAYFRKIKVYIRPALILYLFKPYTVHLVYIIVQQDYSNFKVLTLAIWVYSYKRYIIGEIIRSKILLFNSEPKNNLDLVFFVKKNSGTRDRHDELLTGSQFLLIAFGPCVRAPEKWRCSRVETRDDQRYWYVQFGREEKLTRKR